MHIQRNMIHPELRNVGSIIRTILPHFTEKKFLFCNFLMSRRMKGKCKSNITYEEKWIPRQDGTLLRICVYLPQKRKENVPGLLWLHGGGYAIGIPEQDELYISRFIDESNCVVIAPDYTRSVDKPYPAALEDCYVALLWLKSHGNEYGMRSNQIIVGGDSAGGGLAAAISLYARDKKEVAVAFQMPLYPMLDDRMNTESAKDNDAPLWNSKSNYIGWKLYLGELFETDEVPAYAAPSRGMDFRGLPPTFSFVGSIEPFRDETVNYINSLRENGIPVHFKLYDGCFHAFDLVGMHKDIGKEAITFLMETFRFAVENYFAEQPK